MSLEITLALPPKQLSPNARSHWIVKSKATKEYRRAACWAGLSFAIRQPLKAATVQVHWYTKTITRPDADNALASLKAAFDGLTDAGVFDDDKGLTHQPIRFAKDANNPRVVLCISPTE